MASWNLMVYFSHRFHSFSLNPNTHFNDLIQMIRTHLKLNFDNYLLEIYDSHFRRYIIPDEEYILNLQDRLPRTSVSTLNGRILNRRKYLSSDRKRKRTSSVSPANDHLIIWLDSYIGQPENCRSLKHKFHTTTMLDIARPMLDYEDCIDDLIQIDPNLIEKKNHLNTFSNKDECLHFLRQVELPIKILFITSHLFSEEIIPVIISRVHRIYILVNDRLSSYHCPVDYKSNLLIFHDNRNLLICLIRDLGQNFVEKAEMISKSSRKQAIICFKWARQLFHRANEIDHPAYWKTLNSINRQLETLESNGNEKDEKFALECDEGL